MFWKLFAAFLALTTTIVTVPPEKNITQIPIRIGEAKEITIPPSFPFQSIYSKSIYTLDSNGNERDFSSVCKPIPANILFNKTYSFTLNINRQQHANNDLVTTFDEIKADSRILDTTMINNRAYLLLRENLIMVFNVKINSSAPISIKIPTQYANQTIQTGFFVQINSSKLLLITEYEAFKIEGEVILKMQGYENFTDLESARELFDNYFVVCGISSGIVIYSLDNDTVTKRSTLNASFFQRDAIFISDMAYNPNNSQLFVSDQKFGINIVKLNKTEVDLKPVLSNFGYRKVGCYVIVFVEGNLYASCDDLFKIQYSTDQAIVDMPSPMFKIKELLVYKGLIVAVGEDLIAKYYNDKETEEAPQFDFTERLIFYGDNKYLMANYYELQVGTFNIKYPSIECSTDNESIDSIVNAVVKTEAQCSDAYFTKYDVKINSSSAKGQKCIYTSPVQLHFWQGGQFDPDIILISMGVLFLVAGIIIIWAIFIYNKEIYLRRTLDMYANPNVLEMRSTETMPAYNHMAEEKDDSKFDDVDVSNTKKPLQEDHGTHSID